MNAPTGGEQSASVGRPTLLTPELTDEICGRISGGDSVRTICDAQDMPAKATIFRWLRDHEQFRDQYELACKARCEALGEDLLEIADDGSNDWMVRNDENNPGWVANGEHIQRSRLRVDTRKWILSRLLPKKYGDRLDTTLKGPGEDGSHKVEVSWSE